MSQKTGHLCKSDRFIARYTNSVRCSTVQSGFDSSSLCDSLVNIFNSKVTHIMDDIAPVKSKIISGKTKAPWKNMERVRALKRTCCRTERR